MNFEPIGTVIQSCFKERFAIPRQASLVSEARAVIRLRPDRALRESLRGLDAFSHAWIVFVFNHLGDWKPLVRPPRLGGKRKVGVLATRSPHRPNPIGLSAVKIERIDLAAKQGPEIHVSGGDFLDGTLVLDVKPYIPYADSITRARAGWAADRPGRIPVAFSTAAGRRCRQLEATRPGLRRLLRQVLSLDPRPAFQSGRAGDCSCRILDLDIHWKVENGRAFVFEIDDLSRPS
jgi:tRNA-Thr(GGU) m(6)t(6)A37 methyltransferase TsaA